MHLRLYTTALAATLLLGGVGISGLGACEPRTPAKQVSSTFEVHGMVCESCEEAITAKVMALGGVSSVSASHSQKRVRVLHDPAEIPALSIAAAIETLGYTVVPQPTAQTPDAASTKP
ncbi:MAG TPA: heavy-metal-associated domain-containing protein [Nannocystis exedens]|nr:heavy-metal-associated domain-containing protein [Nannocystis exedens]